MKYLFVMDPVGSINHETDSTLLMMRESDRRGHELFYCTVEDLFVDRTFPHASIRRVTFNEGDPVFCLGEREAQPLSSVDALFMRKDPPFDMNYVFATYLLELASRDTFIINHPCGIRSANEKLYALNFPDAIPESLISKDLGQLKQFLLDVGGEMIIKPLAKCGGEGVFYIKEGDKNLHALIETSTSFGMEFIMAQRYLPEIKDGDKRIILINGEPVGAVSRVPQDNEHRGNIHVGGSSWKCDITERDLELCRIIAPRLRDDGLYFVGLDVIGDWITEINVTSPTCIVEINRLNGVQLENLLINFVEEQVGLKNN
ncbi:MAG: glutathione synthase [Proteobacteria bacterium]|nr:glutathione synthase [Pseudomonadota bacterium]